MLPTCATAEDVKLLNRGRRGAFEPRRTRRKTRIDLSSRASLLGMTSPLSFRAKRGICFSLALEADQSIWSRARCSRALPLLAPAEKQIPRRFAPRDDR